ncbi:hypothetical protein GIB67_029693 [Kingdonia uniflora]|uniref:Homoserine dehydrogenase n=1 Tax=Kingdonia uniflora TaxID=39325 RepID=A0A7J7LM03_9MAGN|nr:hypothetical protein GIB67_029693 [Kingdonia uniflora]
MLKYAALIAEMMSRFAKATLDYLPPAIEAYIAIKVLKVEPLITVNPEDRWRRIFPMSFVFCINIVFGNVSLRYIPVSFMQAIKSFTPTTIVVLQWLVWRKYFDWRIWASLVPIVGEILLTSVAELSFNMFRFCAALFVCLATSIKTISTESLLHGYKFDCINTVFYMTPFATMILALPALFLKGHGVWVWFHTHETLCSSLILILTSGVLGFCLNFSIFYVIHSTTAVTFNVTGNIKLVVAVMVSWLIFRNPIPALNAIGRGVTLIACTFYGFVRHKLSQQTPGIPKTPRTPLNWMEMFPLVYDNSDDKEFKYTKFIIGYIMKVPSGDVPYIIGYAISLSDNSIGCKGSILHNEVSLSTLQNQRDQQLYYMKQDIRLLAGVVYKAQEIYWTKYGIDITSCLTLSSLAMKIYRFRYYNDKEFPIHIPNRNEDKFFQTAYYGGHADMYKPCGKNLYYCDVNLLHPFIMKTYPMPCSKPVWNGNMRGVDLSVIYGFIQAYIITPKNIDKPFLPIRDKNGTLLFPKGKFVGVYLSDELRYAQLGCGGVGTQLLQQIVSCRLKNSLSSLATLSSFGECKVFTNLELTRKFLDIAALLGKSNGLAFVDCTASSETIGVLCRAVELGCCIVLANKKLLTSVMDDYKKLVLHPLVSEVEDGKPFSEVVKAAKGLGYIEPDPRDDLSGMDVARKALILTRLLGWRINMDNITVESLYPQEMGPNTMSLDDFMASGLPSLGKDIKEKTKVASINGNVMRYVCLIEGSSYQVGIKELPKDSPLGRLRGSDNVVEIYSRCYKELPLAIQGAGASNDTTTAGVLADILDLQELFP